MLKKLTTIVACLFLFSCNETAKTPPPVVIIDTQYIPAPSSKTETATLDYVDTAINRLKAKIASGEITINNINADVAIVKTTTTAMRNDVNTLISKVSILQAPKADTGYVSLSTKYNLLDVRLIKTDTIQKLLERQWLTRDAIISDEVRRKSSISAVDSLKFDIANKLRGKADTVPVIKIDWPLVNTGTIQAPKLSFDSSLLKKIQ